MEPASIVQGVSFRKNPRRGQLQVFEAIDATKRTLNAKLPTGYGKTYTACCVYSLLKNEGRVNRFLAIFPTTAQLEQFLKDGANDLADAGVDGTDLRPVDVSFFGTKAILMHKKDQRQVFAITVQSLRERRGRDIVKEMMASGRWFGWPDECHHYGDGKSWADAIRALHIDFLLSTSATPYRKEGDGIFGPLDVDVTYWQAYEEKAVKPLRGHAYKYRIDIVDAHGDEHSLSVEDVTRDAGGDDPDKIDKLFIDRRMRWNPKYISPLVSIPIERMLSERQKSGFRLQALIGAMSVRHAAFLCDQVREMYPELKVEWVGTGDDGRTDEDNKRIVSVFCPPKSQSTGKREPVKDSSGNDMHIDVLIHVGIAGEGLDSVTVSEVIFCNNASICNKKLQEAGRAARYLPGVVGHVNFDATSEFAEENYIGFQFMRAMDLVPPLDDDEDGDESASEDEQGPLIEDEPKVRLYDLTFVGVDSGDPGVQQMAKVLDSLTAGEISLRVLMQDKDHPDWQTVIDAYKHMRRKEAEEFDERATINQWRDIVQQDVTILTGQIVKLKYGKSPVSGALRGMIKKAINERKKGFFGEVSNDLDILKNHHRWCLQLQREIKENGIPSWLR